MERHDLDTETYETIPWSQLAPQHTPLVTRIGLAAAAVVAAGVLALFLASFLRDDPDRVVVTPAAAATAEVAATPDVAASTIGPPVATPAPAAERDLAAGVLYTEADLMAVIPEEEQRLAAMRAEWFVTDFFTVDGDPAAGSAVRAALPAGLDVDLPHDSAEGVSYVEWAGAVAVVPDGLGRYLVDVAFRTLAGVGDGSLQRLPVRAVRIRVQIDDTGAAAILDLPEPLELRSGSIDVSPPPESDPPREVAERAVDLAAAVGEGREVLTAGVDATGWRIVVAVVDPSGVAWPLAVRPGG